ncbi:MAG TPA: hypothetical protein DCW71_07950 [Alistipes sp.]|nr:hypothetical protein [Alistipes sp.]
MRRCFFRMPQTVRTCGGMRSAASGTETHCRSVFGNAEAFGNRTDRGVSGVSDAESACFICRGRDCGAKFNFFCYLCQCNL